MDAGLKKTSSSNETRAVLTRVLLGRGTELDKLDVVSNLVAEKIAMSEAMSDRISSGSFVAGHGVLQHLLSLDQVLETVLEMQTTGNHDVPFDCLIYDGDCVGHN
jgi:hypothetical protein